MSVRHHIRACLGLLDDVAAEPSPGLQSVSLDMVSGRASLDFGLGRLIKDASKIGLAPTEIGVDLLLLAATVHAADTRIPRQMNSQDAWTREIALSIPVSEPDRWAAAEPLLRRMLDFLSGDRWRLEFRPRPDAFARIALAARQPTPAFTRLCLFSGGVDSLVGAIDLLAAGELPLLISHAGEGATSKPQATLEQALRGRYPAAGLVRLRGWITFARKLLDPTGSKEPSTRARSFLFFAIAAFAGTGLGRPFTISVPENGLIALNVPLDPLRLGSLSTRTTHPFYMARWNDLLRDLGVAGRVQNPYQFRTKGEMLAGCADQELLQQALPNSMSCSSPTKGRWDGRAAGHCGYCVPCLIRRAAINAAFHADATTYSIADLHAAPLNTAEAEGRDVRSFQLASARVCRNPAVARALIHKPGRLTDFTIDEQGRLAEVYVRGMNEIADLLAGVTARPQ